MATSSPWLTNTPKNWTTGRLKDLIGTISNGTWGDEPTGERDVFCVRAADFDRTGQRVNPIRLPQRSVDSAEFLKHKLSAGDLILEKSGGGETQPVGMAVLFTLDVTAVCSNFCARIRPACNVDPRFLTYALAAAYYQGLTTRAIKQTTGIQNLDTTYLLGTRWAYPEGDEQRRIADFLDAETSRVDQLSGLRRKQLDLINERAAARVLSAVQGSCIPGDRKDSGLGWLGEIPQSWRIAAVSHFFEVELGKMLNQDRTSGVNLRPYLRVANVQWDEVTVDELAYMDFPPVEQQRYRLEVGDLLVNEGGSWPGRAAIWHGEIPEMYYQKALHRIRPRGKERTRWLYYCLVAAERMKVFVVQGNTSTITHLTREQLRPQRFPFPDHETQDILITELDQAHDRDAMLKAKLRHQLSLMAERRQALITAAVTGQFNVSTASGRGIED